MPYIGKPPEDTFRGLASYDTFTGDGSTTTFDVSENMPDGGQNDVTVVVDNVRQEPGASKSYTLGQDSQGRYRRVTFNTAPDSGAEIYVINPGRSTSLITVTDNSISAAKLTANSVTTAKIEADAITNAKIADDQIDSEHYVDGSIDNVHLANSSITINGNAVSLGGSITAGTDWQAVTVADGSTTLNAEAGKGYFLDTNAGVIEVFLPTSPTRGDTIILADYSGTFATNRCIVNTGGVLIDSTQGGPAGGGNDFEISTNNAIVELVYVDAAKGWLVKNNTAPSALSTITGSGGGYDTPEYIVATGGTVITTGDFKTHVFTGDGCFVVTNGSGSLAKVDYMVVAGGGASGARYFSGGGGAGGFRLSNSYGLPAPTTSPLASSCGVSVTTQTYPITVGGGGAGVPGDSGINGNPGSSSIFSTITSAGGGGGAHNDEGPTGENGGSGGGGASPGSTGGGTGNTPPVSPPQGQDGGTGAPASPFGAGGGGGAGATGSNYNSPTPSVGGIGSFIDDTFIGPTAPSYGEAGPVGSTRYFGGGGGGGAGCAPGPTTICGGIGGGGDGKGNATPGTAGVVNTGGGGGGTGNNVPSPGASAAGGQGIVIIRYKFQN